MDLEPPDDRRDADVATYTAYGYDNVIIANTKYEVFGVEDRESRVEVLRGRYLNVSGAHRVQVTLYLTARSPELSLERAGELVRSTFFHYHSAHHYCDRIASYVVTDVTGATVALPQDRCQDV